MGGKIAPQLRGQPQVEEGNVFDCGRGGEFSVTSLSSEEMRANELLVLDSRLPLLGLISSLSFLLSYGPFLCTYHFKKGRQRSSPGNPSFVSHVEKKVTNTI